jgi:hypothetical protein
VGVHHVLDDAQTQAAAAGLQAERDRVRAVLGQLLSGGPKHSQDFQRQHLPVSQTQFDGKRTTVLHLDGQAGVRLGFEPGDLILVEPQPATAPAEESPQAAAARPRTARAAGACRPLSFYRAIDKSRNPRGEF